MTEPGPADLGRQRPRRPLLGSASSSCRPTTATVYGDERYGDRLPDPGPEGRGEGAPARRGHAAARRDAISTDGLSVEERITLDMVKVVCDLTIRQDDERIDVLKVVDQLEGPQQTLPVITQFQPADTPGAARPVHRPHSTPIPAFMAANTELLHEGLVRGLTASRISTERTIAQLERMLAVAPEESVVVQTARVASDADRERVLEVVRDAVYPADAAVPRRPARRVPARPVARSRVSGRPPNGDELYRTQILAWTTLDARPGGPSPDRPRRARADRARATARSPARPGSATTPSPTAATSAADPANIPTSRDAAPGACSRGHRAGDWQRRRGTSAACRARLQRSRRRGVQGGRRPVRLLLPADDRRVPARHLLREHVRPAVAHLLEARHHDLSRGRARPSLPDRARDGAPGPAGVPAARVAPGRRRVRRGLGPVRRAPRRRDGPVPQRGRALRDARRDGLAGGPAGRRHRHPRASSGRASRASHRCSRPACPTRTRISRRTATSRGPGQALTYKVGQREIERLRGEIARRDGSRFDLRAFHDAVIGHGSLPLATLARELPTWVATPA